MEDEEKLNFYNRMEKPSKTRVKILQFLIEHQWEQYAIYFWNKFSSSIFNSQRKEGFKFWEIYILLEDDIERFLLKDWLMIGYWNHQSVGLIYKISALFICIPLLTPRILYFIYWLKPQRKNFLLNSTTFQNLPLNISLQIS